MTTKLDFFPIQDGYTYKTGNGIVSVTLDGGFPRQRRDIIGEAGLVNVTWYLTQEQYSLFMFQYRVSLNEGLDPALVPLLTDFPVPVDHKVIMIPDSFTYSNKGLSHTVSMQLKVLPNKFQVHTNITMSFTPGFPSTGQILTVGGPDFTEIFEVGNKIQIIGLKAIDGSLPQLDLDGQYVVNSLNSAFVNITSPEVTNPSWATLPSISPAADTFVTVVKVPD